MKQIDTRPSYVVLRAPAGETMGEASDDPIEEITTRAAALSASDDPIEEITTGAASSASDDEPIEEITTRAAASRSVSAAASAATKAAVSAAVESAKASIAAEALKARKIMSAALGAADDEPIEAITSGAAKDARAVTESGAAKDARAAAESAKASVAASAAEAVKVQEKMAATLAAATAAGAAARGAILALSTRDDPGERRNLEFAADFASLHIAADARRGQVCSDQEMVKMLELMAGRELAQSAITALVTAGLIYRSGDDKSYLASVRARGYISCEEAKIAAKRSDPWANVYRGTEFPLRPDGRYAMPDELQFKLEDV